MIAIQESWEIAQSFYNQTRFDKAIYYFKHIADQTLALNDYDQHVKALHYQLRCFAEMENFDQVTAIQEQLLALISAGHSIPSEGFYVLSLSSHYKGQNEQAQKFAQTALDKALASENSRSLLYALFSLATLKFLQNDIKGADEIIAKGVTILDVHPDPELLVSFSVVKSYILRQRNELDSALALLTKAQEPVARSRNLNLHTNLQYNLALCFWDMKDYAKASLYLSFAKNTVDLINHRRLSRAIHELDAKLSMHPTVDYDLIFKTDGKTVIERSRGAINFHSQFILLDLLKVLAKEPGRVFKKEELAEILWNERASTDVIDNRLYVTIRRLRDLIEPDKNTPRYIRRSKGGYTLSHECRIQFEGALV